MKLLEVIEKLKELVDWCLLSVLLCPRRIDFTRLNKAVKIVSPVVEHSGERHSVNLKVLRYLVNWTQIAGTG